MTDKSPEAFDYQCECNLSYVSEKNKTVVEIGQGHLKDMFRALSAENAALKKDNGYLRALADFEELLDNAAQNWGDETKAPWHWDFELRDQITILREVRVGS